mmetsp:Transcript_118410/g.206088  ORF Transcript_118410/g.206088 Transcript_118410/m.206088 type:complete len:81 (-) Transcript_118410:865-1107(-)
MIRAHHIPVGSAQVSGSGSSSQIFIAAAFRLPAPDVDLTRPSGQQPCNTFADHAPATRSASLTPNSAACIDPHSQNYYYR